ncbi:MAG: helicase HerA-like domain-containing protein [Burkholderiales bacterium]
MQHALRAFTPRDEKAVKSAATTMRANPKLNVEKVITELGVGEALVSFLDEKGRPNIVERAFIIPPQSKIGPAGADKQQEIIRSSAVYGHYEQAVDRESAYEKLKDRRSVAPADAQSQGGGIMGTIGDILGGGGSGQGRQGQTVVQAAVKSAARAIGSELGRQVLRGVLGSILGGRKR